MRYLKQLQRPRTVRARGSVLVFAVIVLVLLFMLGTAFVLYVRQESRASANALQNTQADLAADAALNHALRQLRTAAQWYTFATPDGLFDPTRADYLQVDPDPALLSAGQPQRNVFRLYEAYPGETAAAATIANAEGHAWLWHHGDATFFSSAGLEPLAEPLRFTDAKVAHYATHNGGVKQYRVNGPEHAGLARRFVVDVDQAAIAKFYDPITISRPLPLSTWSGGRHAEFYVWVADLDGKLFANPQADGASGLPGWTLDPAFANVGTESAQTASVATFKYLRDFAGMSLVADGFIDPSWWGHTPPYHSTAELWSLTGVATPAAPAATYYHSRYGLERYFTTRADVTLTAPEAAKYQVTTSVKDVPTALNINTANWETLGAVLARVPLVDGYDPGIPAKVTENQAKAGALAARICAKRPFLGRMDFEDFLAAHVNSKMPVAAADVEDMAAAPDSPSGMLYLAIEKRQLPPALNVVTYLDLDQYGIDNATFTAKHPEYNAIITTAFMKPRFAFFRADDAIAPLFVDAANNAMLSTKAFNNLLNAVAGKRRDGTYGHSFYSYDGVTLPFTITGSGTPKFEYNELLQADIASIKTYEINRMAPDDNKGTLKAWHPTISTTGYYEMSFHRSDDTQEMEYGTSVTPALPGDKVVFINLNGEQDSPRWGNDQTDTTAEIYELYDGINPVQCESTVHGPLRAYQNDTYDPATAKPTMPAGTDISWTPRLAYRSRFFAVYVLSRALGPNGTPYSGGTRRIEAVYDALKDEVVWRRQPATEKRSLGDPEP